MPRLPIALSGALIGAFIAAVWAPVAATDDGPEPVETVHPADVGLDAVRVGRLRTALSAGAFSGLTSAAVVRRGELVVSHTAPAPVAVEHVGGPPPVDPVIAAVVGAFEDAGVTLGQDTPSAMAAPDLARLCALLLTSGMADGNRVAPAAWVRATLDEPGPPWSRRVVDTPDGAVTVLEVQNDAQGSAVYIAPERDLVVTVVRAPADPAIADQASAPTAMILDTFVLPAAFVAP